MSLAYKEFFVWPEMFRIKIDKDVFTIIQKQAVPFVDEPNDVLRRIMGLPSRSKGGFKESARIRKRIASELILPLQEYRLPILRSLNNHSGIASRNQVLNDVFTELKDKFNSHDLKNLRGKVPRWRTRTEFVKNQMDNEGLVESGGRGVWKITTEGRKQLTSWSARQTFAKFRKQHLEET